MLTVYGGGINPIPSPNSRSLSKLSWLVAIDGSELAFTNAGKLPNDSELDGPGPISRSLSGLDAYDRREVFMGKRKSSDKDSTGYFTLTRNHIRDNKESGRGILLEFIWNVIVIVSRWWWWWFNEWLVKSDKVIKIKIGSGWSKDMKINKKKKTHIC